MESNGPAGKLVEGLLDLLGLLMGTPRLLGDDRSSNVNKYWNKHTQDFNFFLCYLHFIIGLFCLILTEVETRT